MKKTLKALQMIILSMAIAFMFCVVPVLADESTSTEYTYTIRIYAGNQGSFGGGYVQIFDNLKAGEVVAFDFGSVTLKNPDKYYVMGIRESGKDNYDSSLTDSAITVKGDADYVVAYGILGSSVAYTVNYVDAAGAPLLPSATYYGNVGDEPVIAFKYVDGYFPNAYNLSRKLSANAADNVFTFVYSSTAITPQPQPEEEGGGGAGAGGAGAGGAGAGGAGAGGAGAGGAEGAGGAAAPGAEGGPEAGPEAGPEGGPGGEEVIPGNPTPGEPQPTTEENIVETTGPLAPGAETTTSAESETTTISGGGGNGGISGLGIAGIAAGGVVLAGGITAVIVALTRRKK